MLNKKIFLSSALGLCCGALLIYAFPAAAKSGYNLPVYDVSQGDGDPSENAAPDLLNDEKDETADDAVATITAEGDFLLPTYLLPVENEQASETGTTKNEMIPVDTNQADTQDIPALMANQTQTDAQTQTTAMDVDAQPTQETVMAEDINIDIDTQALQTPQTQPAPRQMGAGYANSRMGQQVEGVSKPAIGKKPLLIPLTQQAEQPVAEPVVAERVRHVVPSEYADTMLDALKQNARPSFIMPQEIKVSFYKNATDFSGQTLKWIKAFSMNALADPRLIVQIRLSTQDPSIQNKRLLVLQNALSGYGLSTHQLQVVYTDRPVDSLVLRTVEKPQSSEIVVKKSSTGKNVEKRVTKW